MKKKKGFKFFRWLFLYIPLWFVAITVLWVLVLRWMPVYVTPLMVVRTCQNWGDDSFVSHKTEEIPKKSLGREDNTRSCSNVLFPKQAGFLFPYFPLYDSVYLEQFSKII